MKKTNLQTFPLDVLLTLGKFLSKWASFNDISQITLAAILEDREMLDHFIEIERYDKMKITYDVALAGNLQVLKWVIIEKKCPMDQYTCDYAATG